MRLVVLGAGGIGAYYGAGFAKGGADVTLVARGAHLAAIRALWFDRHDAENDAERHELRATDDPAGGRPGGRRPVLRQVVRHGQRGCAAAADPRARHRRLSPSEWDRQRGTDRGGHRLAARPWRRRLHLRRGHHARGRGGQWAAQHRVRGMERGGPRHRGSAASSRRLGPVGSARPRHRTSRSSSGRNTCCWQRCPLCPPQPSSHSAKSGGHRLRPRSCAT